MSTVIIIGGAGDIGSACARTLQQAGHTVEVGDLTLGLDDSPTPWNRSIVDCTNREAVETFIRDVVARHGRLDTLVCSQGVVMNEDFLDITADAWESTLAVNLSGAMVCAQAAARQMIGQYVGPDGLRGRLVFVGSWVSVAPWPGSSSYAVSKAGLRTLSAAIALELADRKVTSNVIEPGIVEAGLSVKLMESDPEFRERAVEAVPLGHLQDAASVASALRYLCDPSSAYMTGSVLRIDGGARVQRG
jgi:NAD(P)-dependent dehydrogenase (short-subunit alcohol dehydrogenase family)